MRSVQGQESEIAVQAEDWSARLLEDKKRCRMISDKRCVMCDSRVGEGMAHFLVGCGEFKSSVGVVGLCGGQRVGG